MTNIAPLDQLWILQKISPEIEQLNEIPLFGNAPSFDWALFAKTLSDQLGVEPLSFRAEKQQWRLSEEIFEGIGHHPLILPIDFPSLSGRAYWMMTKQEIYKLTSWMLYGKSSRPPASSELLQEGFYRYLALEALDALSQIDPFQTLAPILEEDTIALEEKTFCIDVAIHFADTKSFGRLAIPHSLQKQWGQHFKTLYPESISLKTARSLELALGVHIGRVLLYPSQWQNVKKGDFILLDKGSYDPRHAMGLATLSLNETPLFSLDIEPKKIHLLNYAFIYEDATDMPNNPSEDPEIENNLPLEEVEEGQMVSLKEVPIAITVELAKIRMTLEKLMHLTPGNVLDLDVGADQTVSLIAAGKKIGTAELVYLGEKLGIRILELG